MENKNTTSLAEQKLEAPECKEDSLLPIAEKGLFFHDSFFEDIRKHFETAIDQILDTWGETKSVSDLMSSYRRVRDRNLQQENHVMAFSEDDHNHKRLSLVMNPFLPFWLRFSAQDPRNDIRLREGPTHLQPSTFAKREI
nr:uncharacterized protein LOC113820695 [Penaeus vannamei]